MEEQRSQPPQALRQEATDAQAAAEPMQEKLDGPWEGEPLGEEQMGYPVRGAHSPQPAAQRQELQWGAQPLPPQGGRRG